MKNSDAGSYQDLVNCYCSFSVRRTVCRSSAGKSFQGSSLEGTS